MLCPSSYTCAPGLYLCSDMTCREEGCEEQSASQEQTGLCTTKGREYRCPDGSCSDQMINCPSSVVCPEDRQIRCSDGNCRSSRAHCEPNTNCPHQMRLCPSGACVKVQQSSNSWSNLDSQR